MVTVLKTESGTQILSPNLQKVIQSIKEIVGNHSDSEIYNALKESNMDPNETAQKLLNQDPFHEVRRKRDKKKEMSYVLGNSFGSQMSYMLPSEISGFCNEDAGYNGYVEPRKRNEYTSQGAKFYSSDRNARRGGYTRTPTQDAGISREFRVVRDNRVNQNSDRETKVSSEVSSSVNVQRINNGFEKSSSVSASNQRHSGGQYVQNLNGVTDFQPKVAQDMNLNIRKEHLEERKSAVPVSASQVSTVKPNDSQLQSGSHPSSNAVGVYASASDPVHVPSPDSRSSAAVGAIRREVGVVGGRQHSSESTSKQSFQHNISNLKPVLGSSPTTEPFRPINSISRNDQSQSTVADSVMTSSAGTRFANHFNGRLHQQAVGHQKGVLPSKEWKPKTSQKSHVPSPGVIGSPVKSTSKPSDDSKNVDREANHLEEKLSQVNIHESENVIIAQHIRVPESDRCRLTFGSFGVESDDAENSASGFQAPECVQEESQEPSPSSKQISPVDNQVRNSGSSSPSVTESESQLPEKKDSPGASNTESYTDMALAPNSPSFAASKSQQQEPAGLPNLSAYDPQHVYDIPYFRPSVDDAVRGPGLPSPQEVLSSHVANSIPASSMAMMQQQAPMAQMYPQVHLSHYANVMPYRQFIPPLYVPPMVPGYSGNPGYPHLSNGSSYVLMPGGSSHLSPNNIKYGVQQFKPLPGGSPTGFGNFASPTGYAINAPGVVGGPTGIDDSSRLKYKDNNLYVPNPQAETSEVWMQNQRELAGMQSTPYFNMQGHTAHPHPASAYLQSHTSYNGVAQSSHMQFPGMYPPQPAAHHMAGSNIGVGVAPPAAPGPQVGPYHQQPPQMGHLNWTTNF